MRAGITQVTGRCNVSKDEVFQPWLQERKIEDVEAIFLFPWAAVYNDLVATLRESGGNALFPFIVHGVYLGLRHDPRSLSVPLLVLFIVVLVDEHLGEFGESGPTSFGDGTLLKPATVAPSRRIDLLGHGVVHAGAVEFQRSSMHVRFRLVEGHAS